jgi:hypothetical protein
MPVDLYKVSLEEALEHMTVIHERRINKRTVARICQIQEESGERSNFLNIVIHDERANRWISLRLSTFRKIVTFIVQKGLDKARRLNMYERLKMARKEGKAEVTLLGKRFKL